MKSVKELSEKEMQTCFGGRITCKTSLVYDATYILCCILYYGAQGCRMMRG